MTTAWIQLFIAGLLEIGWAIGLKYSDGFNFRGKPAATAATLAMMVTSMYLLAQAVRPGLIPIGTGYAIWTGIGALGAATLGILLFNEPATLVRLVCLLALVFGIVGLKLSASASGATPPASQPVNPMMLYVGTYTDKTSQGIYRVALDPGTGTLGEPTLVAKTKNPSYLAVAPGGRTLYAIAEVGEIDGKQGGAVVAYAIEADGGLRELNREWSGGPGPCYVSVSPDAKSVFVANYGGGSVAMLPVNADGSLRPAATVDQHVGSSVHPKRQDRAYAHSILPDPTGRFAIAADLGTDELIVYRVEGDGMARASVTKATPGAGPRHVAFSPEGTNVYVVNELDNTVARFAWDANAGTLSHRQTIGTLPPDFTGENTTAELLVHPTGRVLYASNRGHNSIAAFRIDETTGELSSLGTVPSGGPTPRNFVIDPTGRFLIASNQKPGNLVAFAIDPRSGALTPTGSTLELSMACCARFVVPGIDR